MSITEVRENLAMDCPAGRAQASVEGYFARHRRKDGTSRVTLRVPLHGIWPLPGLPLEHEVTVITRLGRDEENLNDAVQIAWTPRGEVPLPDFKGTLTTWAGDDPNTSFVEIAGYYTPPLGIMGEAFDEVIGHAIAQRTAHALLEEIARFATAPVTD